MSYTAVIAEDEQTLRDHLEKSLRDLWPGLQIVAKASNGVAALQSIQSMHPDLAFLDIRMPGLTGLEVARSLNPAPFIVFITAYDEYAVNAFEQGAIDYLLKPIQADRLQETITRLQRNLALRTPPANLEGVLDAVLARLPKAKEYLRWVRAGVANVVTQIPIEDVVYFQAEDKYSRVVTRTSDALIRVGISQLEESLDPRSFARTHRSVIVNLAEIKTIRRNGSGAMELVLNSRKDVLPVSRAYSDVFRQM